MENEGGGRNLGMLVVVGVIGLLLAGLFIVIIGSMDAGCGDLPKQGRFLLNNETGCWERLDEGLSSDTVALSRFGAWSYLVTNGDGVVERVDYPFCPTPDVLLNSARMPYLSVFYPADVVAGNFVSTSLGDFREKDREKAALFAAQQYEATVVIPMVRCVPVSLSSGSIMAFESFEKPAGFSENFTPDQKYFRMGGVYYEHQEQVDLETEKLGMAWHTRGSYEVLVRGNVVKTVTSPAKYILAGVLAVGLLGGGGLAAVVTRRRGSGSGLPSEGNNEGGNSQSQAGQNGEPIPPEMNAAAAMIRARNSGSNPLKAVSGPMATHIANLNQKNWYKAAVAQLDAQKKNGIITEDEYNKELGNLNKWM